MSVQQSSKVYPQIEITNTDADAHLDMSSSQTSLPRQERTARSPTQSTHFTFKQSLSKSPIRSSHNNSHHHYTTQRLRTPSIPNSQRRSSLSNIGDSNDILLASSIGMPYAFPNYSTANSSNSTSSSRTVINGRNTSSRSSPRSSFNSPSVDYISYNNARRYSEQLPKTPSTAEVFDQMEREQDAIVLKLMREIAQLKENNRALVNTINQLTNNSYPSVKSTRNNSSALEDYDMNNLHIQDD